MSRLQDAARDVVADMCWGSAKSDVSTNKLNVLASALAAEQQQHDELVEALRMLLAPANLMTPSERAKVAKNATRLLAKYDGVK